MDTGLIVQIAARSVVGIALCGITIRRIRTGRTRGLPGAATGAGGSVAFASLVSVPVVMDDWVDDRLAAATGFHNFSSWAAVIGYQASALFCARIAETLTTDTTKARVIDGLGIAGIIATAGAYVGTEIVHEKSYGIVSELSFDTVGNTVYLSLFYGFFLLSLGRILAAGVIGLSAIQRGPLAVTFGLVSAGAVAEVATLALIVAKQAELIDVEATAALREILLTGGVALLADAILSYNWEKVHGRLNRFRRLRWYVSEWSQRMRIEGALKVLAPSDREIWSESATSRTAGLARNRLADIEDAIRATADRSRP
ncbi:hypothetical protein [Rhodococcus rhodnii]|uniref:hypothetical protein n=1 Tax=Rhodococcus rhodnii TaxID=38312 RepID=UPI000B2461BA|nr:hypothetical protein [Rhodococcus rhodnii]